MQNEIVLILGKKGCGKTTLAKQRIEKKTRVYILDPRAEYREGLIVESYPVMIQALLDTRPHFRLICRFQVDEDIDRFFDFVFTTGNCLLVLEEVDWLCNSRSIHPGLENIIKYGRHKKIDMIAVSRRPAEISRLLSSQADEVISFQQTEPRDLQYLAERGFDREKLMQLQKYNHLSITV